MNPNAAATGKPAASTVVECAANYDDAVLFNRCRICPAMFEVVFVSFSISIHFISIHPLYDRYERPTTNKPILTAAIFITFFMAYPATAPNRNPLPAENTRFSIDNY